MASAWKMLPQDAPGDAATVWVARRVWTTPFQAVWSAAAATFTHSSGLVLPWYESWRWRPL